jgi:hypothetical protein
MNPFQIVRQYGLGFCLFRAKYELLKKTGLLKLKFPPQKWSQLRLEDFIKKNRPFDLNKFTEEKMSGTSRFFFDDKNRPNLKNYDNAKLIAAADEILQNKFKYFFDKTYFLGDDPDWFLNPVTQKCERRDKHWCDINFFDPDVGDIKFIWEPSRFAWSYILARAYAATNQVKYAQKFWDLFESWLNANQPNMGPNYACGQECAIRLMAMCFAFYVFAGDESSTLERKERLLKAIVFHADRVEKNIEFAISTKTNHSITEAAGIYTVGLLFPEFKKAQLWKQRGKIILTSDAFRQIYPDGSYIQHSTNYHRLMLQDYIWVLRLAQLNKDIFNGASVQRVHKAVEFLYQLLDETGRTPNYGSNDGALIVPLNNCDYLDYRPVIQAGFYLLEKRKIFDKGPWDEDLLWLFGDEVMSAQPEKKRRESSRFDDGGYYTIRNKDSWAMIRCHSFKDRPSHADMLHLDLWYKGTNILRDSGSFMYYSQNEWQNYFTKTYAHNTVTVDNKDQMEKISRWLWLRWLKSETIFTDTAYKGFRLFAGRHFGYSRLQQKVVHQRTVLAKNNLWIVVDDIFGCGKHGVELNWHLCSGRIESINGWFKLEKCRDDIYIKMLSDNEISGALIEGDEKRPLGFDSLYYGEKKASPVLHFKLYGRIPIRIVSVISLGKKPLSIELRNNKLIEYKIDIENEKINLDEISAL